MDVIDHSNHQVKHSQCCEHFIIFIDHIIMLHIIIHIVIHVNQARPLLLGDIVHLVAHRGVLLGAAIDNNDMKNDSDDRDDWC